MRNRTLALAAVLALAAAHTAEAAKLKVPQQFPTINAAIAASSNGDTIIVDSGTYHETVTVNLKTNLTLRGKKNAVIDAGGAAYAIEVNLSTGVVVRDLTFRASSTSGLHTNFGSNLKVKDCTFSDHAGNGAMLEYGGPHQVIGCTFEEIAGDGLVVRSDGSLVKDCKFLNCGSKAFTASLRLTSNDLTAEGNLIKGGTFSKGIIVDQNDEGAAENVLVVDNKIIGVPGSGIEVQTSSDAIVLDNVVKKAAGDGIASTSNALRTVIQENVVVKPKDRGLQISGDDLIILENRISKSKDSGLWLTFSCHGALASKNKVTDSKADGIRVTGQNNLIIKNTALDNATVDITNQAGPEENQFVDNVYKTMQ